MRGCSRLRQLDICPSPQDPKPSKEWQPLGFKIPRTKAQSSILRADPHRGVAEEEHTERRVADGQVRPGDVYVWTARIM